MADFDLFGRKEKIRCSIVEGGSNEVYVGRPAWGDLLVKVGYFVLGVVFVLALWWAVAEYYNAFMMKYIPFPTPGKCFSRLYDFFFEDYKILNLTIAEHMKYSIRRWLYGFVIAVLIGVVIGVVMSFDDRFYKFGMVPVNILQMIPGLAWYPVCILLFGLGEKCAIYLSSPSRSFQL